MHAIDEHQKAIVYRLCKRFPTQYPEDYIPAGTRRSFASQPRYVQMAAQGLSVFSTIAAVVATAEAFPRLGKIVVRYKVPRDIDVRLEHLVGVQEHLTVLGDLESFHECLDPGWHLQLDILR